MATGRKACHPPGPSGAHDVSCEVREATEGEKGTVGKNATSTAFSSPYAHLSAIMSWLAMLTMICLVLIVRGFAERLAKDFKEKQQPHPRLRRVRSGYLRKSCFAYLSILLLFLSLPSLVRSRGMRQSLGCVTAEELPATSDMRPTHAMRPPQGGSSFDYRRPIYEHYDRERRYRVPTERWCTGDDPEPGKTHVIIYACGKLYDSKELLVDSSIKMYKGAAHEIIDPETQHDRSLIRGQKCSNAHDGHCPYTRYKCAGSRNPAVKKALLESCTLAYESARRWEKRAKVITVSAKKKWAS